MIAYLAWINLPEEVREGADQEEFILGFFTSTGIEESREQNKTGSNEWEGDA